MCGPPQMAEHRYLPIPVLEVRLEWPCVAGVEEALRNIWCLLDACPVSGRSELGRLCEKVKEIESFLRAWERGAQDTHSYSWGEGTYTPKPL